MLTSLKISNFAIIKDLELNLEEGLTILTGETGAGKSILVNAIKILLGSRFSRDNFRSGEDSSCIEGVFITDNGRIQIKRVFSKNGPSRAYLNNDPVSLEKLKQFTEYLIDLHGQHDHQRLLNPESHLGYLDAFGDYRKELVKIEHLFTALTTHTKELNQLISARKVFQEKKELITFQLVEIAEFPFEVGQDDLLSSEYKLLVNATETRIKISDSVAELDSQEGSIKDRLRAVLRVMENIGDQSPKLAEFGTRLLNSILEIEDITNELERFQDSIRTDQERLDIVSDQMEHLEMLKRKYGGSLESVLTYKDSIEAELLSSSDYDKRIAELEKLLADYHKQYLEVALKLRSKRHTAAVRFEKEVIHILGALDLQGTRFSVNLQPLTDTQMTQLGLDAAEFFISTNPGEEERPLAKTASGGEISRIMLAIKMVLQNRDSIKTMIFDEIDSGISGSTAQKVGNILLELAEYSQVICITHLSQIASKGQHHFKIYKDIKDGRVESYVRTLTGEKRIAEIAGLISGKTVTDSSLKQAKALLVE